MAKSALRVLEIMDFVSTCSGGATHGEIAGALDIPKSSATMLLRDLCSGGWLELDRGGSRYTVGSQVLALAHAHLRGIDLTTVAAHWVEQVFSQLGEFTALAIPRDTEYVIVCARSLASPLAHSLQLGERGPLWDSATGKAILSGLGTSEREQLLNTLPMVASTPLTQTRIEAMRGELASVHRSGIAVARDSVILGITAFAVPVFDANARPIAALSVALPSARSGAALESRIATALREAGGQLSRRLGYRPALTASRVPSPAGRTLKDSRR